MRDTVLVEAPNPHHPSGVHGVGETAVIPLLATVTKAVDHALGLRRTRLPRPRRILEALWEQDGASNGMQRQ
jgi:CO/xanthine dehydrogenase Mo-binding subunit